MTEDVTREFVRLRPRSTFGLLYSPTRQDAEASVGLVIMHPNSDFLEHVGGQELAKRGFRVLCANGQYVNTNRETMLWEQVPLDVKPAVEYLRNLRGIKNVVLVGHSGGGQLMPFYQNVAENGVRASRGAHKLAQGGGDLANLPPADGLLLLDAHHGYSANTLTSMDPAVVDERRPSEIDPTLDVFNPANGYDPEHPAYTDEFRQRYFRAQAERMQRLTQQALARQAAIQAGQGMFPDDEPFPLARTQARIWQLDPTVVAHTQGAYPILKGDGAVVVDVPRSVRVVGVTPRSGGAAALTARQNASYAQGAVAFSVKSWLSSNALRVNPDTYRATEDDVLGIDWHSSNTSTPANLEGVRAPLLIMAMTGHYWMVSGEIFFRHAASADKQLVFVEGASHNIVPCQACELVPGQFGDTVKTTFDYATDWLRERFV